MLAHTNAYDVNTHTHTHTHRAACVFKTSLMHYIQYSINL